MYNLLSTAPSPGKECHLVTLRATFVKGGLLLSFALHYSIMDGGGVINFLNRFAGVNTPNVAADTNSFSKLIK